MDSKNVEVIIIFVEVPSSGVEMVIIFAEMVINLVEMSTAGREG